MSLTMVTPEAPPIHISAPKAQNVSSRETRSLFSRVLKPINFFTTAGIITGVTFLAGENNLAPISLYLFITAAFFYRSIRNLISAALYSYALMAINTVFYYYFEGAGFEWQIDHVGIALYTGALAVIIHSLGIERTQDELWAMRKAEKHTGLLSQESSRVKLSEVVFLQTIISIMKELSGRIDELTGTNASRLREQIGQSHEILHSTQELMDFYNEIDHNVTIIKTMSEKAIESAMLGQKMAVDTEVEIKNVLKTMFTTTNLIKELSASTLKITEIIREIENIADQTNLLALNATIESARAGSSGHSFAVVAEEIGKLAETTQKSTRNVIDMIDSIRISTNVAMDMVPKETAQAENIIEFSGLVHNQLQNVLSGVEYMTDKIHELAVNSKKQASQSTEINQSVHTIANFIAENSEGVRHIFDYVDAMEEQTTNLLAITDRFDFESRVDNPTDRFTDLGNDFLERCREIFETGLQDNTITEENLFDRKYHIIAGFEPPKYHSSFDRFTDAHLETIQEEFLSKDKRLEYFVLVDSNGYVPTHNRKFARRITANKEYNLTYNRTKRIFDDPIGIKAARNDSGPLLQMYKKDTGEYINDLSIPFQFRDRHWGAVRIGFIF